MGNRLPSSQLPPDKAVGWSIYRGIARQPPSPSPRGSVVCSSPVQCLLFSEDTEVSWDYLGPWCLRSLSFHWALLMALVVIGAQKEERVRDIDSPICGAVCNQEQPSSQKNQSFSPWHLARRAAGLAVEPGWERCLGRWGRGAPSPQREVGERSQAGRCCPSDPKAFTE